jgi:uncharacterized damage-inducible protein DinB
MSSGWVAPDVPRADATTVADEPAMLESWLDFHRATLLSKCAGLTGEQLKQRSTEPSTMSLLGLVRHMAEVERSWFQRRVAGRQVDFLYCDLASNPDGDFDDVDLAEAEVDFATYDSEVAAARLVGAAHPLEETFFHTHWKKQMSVRWVYVHMIEEYARHSGHADLLRERIDGATGY